MSSITEPLALPVAAYLAAIEHHGDQLADASERAGLEAAVPTCPGWTVLDLVNHTESVYRHKTAAVLDAGADGPPPWTEVPEGSDIATYRESLATMLAVFGDADLQQPCWTWCTHEHRADWWVRRMAHEAAIHGADAVVAAGLQPTLDAPLAIDGVDELLDEMLVGGPEWGTVTPGEKRVDLVSGDRRWRLRFARFIGTSPNTAKDYDLATLVFDGDGEPDAVIESGPAALDLWLWGRAQLPDGAVSGDTGLVSRLRDLAAEGTG